MMAQAEELDNWGAVKVPTIILVPGRGGDCLIVTPVNNPEI